MLTENLCVLFELFGILFCKLQASEPQHVLETRHLLEVLLQYILFELFGLLLLQEQQSERALKRHIKQKKPPVLKDLKSKKPRTDNN